MSPLQNCTADITAQSGCS